MRRLSLLTLVIASAGFVPSRADGPFYDLVTRYHVGDPEVENPLRDTEGPKSLAVADFNLDGNADIASANLDGSVSVLLGHGDGDFDGQVFFTIPDSTLRGIAAADLDGDTLPDVAAADPTNGVVHILKGQGDGTFTDRRMITIAPGCREVEASDLNGDGSMDLAALAWSANQIAVLLNDGAGGFDVRRHPIPLSKGREPFHLVIGDFNGDGKDDIATANRETENVTVFRGDGDGGLALAQTLDTGGRGPRFIAAGFVDEAVPGGIIPAGATPDLVVANRDSQTIAIFLGSSEGLFDETPTIIGVGDGPRAVAMADLDDDGWQDLIAVNRYGNRVSVLRSLGGANFDIPRGFPVGTSPRHVVVADFNNDGAEDIAVANRHSEDVSFLLGAPGLAGFLVSDALYAAGVDPVAVAIADLNGDGREDLIAANRSSHDVTVHLIGEDGLPGKAVAYEAGYQPQALDVGDLNEDGNLDVVVAGLGAKEAQESGYGGSLVVLFGDGEGRLLPGPTVFSKARGFRPFSVRIGELSSDDIPDLAVATFDGQVLFFQGLGQGEFAEHTLHDGFELLPVPRAMDLEDLDHDGNPEVIAGGVDTDYYVIIPTDGNVFDDTTLPAIKVFTGHFTTAIVAEDLDRDGHQDIVAVRNRGEFEVRYGRGDLTFDEPLIIPVNYEAVATVVEDFDRDEILDIAIGARGTGQVWIFRGLGDRTFELLQKVIVYTPEGMQAGDINGDGAADIAGVGNGIWVLLNGRRPGLRLPDLDELVHTVDSGVYLNEVMPRNRSFYPDEAGEEEAWIEIVNLLDDPIDLKGYTLHWILRDGSEVTIWTFESDTTLASPGYKVVFADGEKEEGPLHASFLLSPEGGRLELRDSLWTLVDAVEVPPVPEDVSYARFRDGARFFNYTSTPTPGAPNVPPTNVAPIIRVRDVTPVDPGEEEPMVITVNTFDDSGVEGVFAWYRAEDEPASGFDLIVLFDDGSGGDAEAGDGIFSGTLPGLSRGKTLLFYVEGIDLDGSWDQDPGDPTPENLFRVPVGYDGPSVEMSELMADNRSGPFDESGTAEDWLELRNCGGSPLSLEGMYLAKDFLHRDTWWPLPAMTLDPGEHTLFWFDRDPHEGPLHAPFHLEGTGDQVFLIGPGPISGIADYVQFGPLDADQVLGSPGCGEAWALLSYATPGEPNVGPGAAFRRGDTSADGRAGLMDVVQLLQAIFLSGAALPCPDSGDVDDDGKLGLADAIHLLLFIFATGPPPAEPGLGACGTDPTPDALPECRYPGC